MNTEQIVRELNRSEREAKTIKAMLMLAAIFILAGFLIQFGLL